MDAVINTQQCKHCEKIFFNRSLWQEHYDWHTGIQLQLRRPDRYHSVAESESRADTIDQINTLVSRLPLQSDETDGKGRTDSLMEVKGIESNLLPNQAQMEQYLQKAIADFPQYEGGGIENVDSEPTIKCPDCDFCFYTQEQCDEHYLSKYCRGAEIAVYIMTIDSSAIGGYRVYKESIPFESKTAYFKCAKCDNVFTTDAERKHHETTHPIEKAKCPNCERIFQGQYELEEHYLWHDDIHLRHHIEHKTEQMKQQRGGPQTWNNTEADIGDSVAGPPPRVQNPWNRKGGFPQYDGDVVAISFLSQEDLEMRYAPDGVLKDLSRETAHLRVSSGASNKIDDSATEKKHSYRKSLKSLLGGRREGASRSPSSQSQRTSLGSSQNVSAARDLAENDVQEHMEWQLFYRHSRPVWVLTHDRSQHVEMHAAEDHRTHKNKQYRILSLPNGLTQEELQARFESLMGEIADYANHNSVENKAKWESLIGEITSAEGLSRTHLEKLNAWFNNEQGQASSTNGEIGTLSGLSVLGYGSPSRILARDRVGRARLITGQDLSRVACHAIGPPRGSLDVVRLALGRSGQAALARGRIRDAERAYTEMFWTMRALYGDEQLQFILLAHLASNIYKKNGNMPNAAGMYMQALRCSQRLYGLKSVNNFSMMTNLAIYYEDIGRLDNAVALYRRSVRGRINAGEKEDALMNIQELSSVYRKMGKDQDALRCIEEAYTGYTQVVGPDHRMTLLTLNNLAAFLFTAGSTERAQSLLGPALPAMTRVLGLDDPVTWGSVCNFVMYYEGSNFPPAVMHVIDQYMVQNTHASLKVLNSVAEHCGKNNLIRKAMETYRALHGKGMSLLGPSDPETWSSLYAYAYTLDRLGETGEALKQYRLLLSHPQARSLLPRSPVDAAQVAVQDLSRKQAALDKEKAEWGLDTAKKCSLQACSNSTLRFCSDCSLVRFCSPACQREDTSHHGACIPSVTVTEATFTIVQSQPDTSSVANEADLLFIQLQLPRRPRCESAREVFINPKTFTTVRISKRPSHILSFQANPGLDLRFMIHRSTPFEWLTPKTSNMLCMLNDVEDSFIVVAPGKSMIQGLVAARDNVFGTESGNVDIPDQNLVEFAQTKAAGDGQFVLGFVVTEWAV